jgi:hypothetical protein
MSQKLTQAELAKFKQEMNSVDWTNPDERRAIALTILEFVREDIQRQDLESLMVDVFTFNIGESPQFTSRKGLKAYVHEPGSYAPRSVITQKVLTIDTEQISVHPEFELNQLRAGRYGTIADVRQMAVDELLNRKYSIIWSTVIGSIASTDGNYGTFASGAAAATKLAAVDTAIDWVEDYAPSGPRAIVGRYNALGWIRTTSLWSDNNQEKIENTGVAGMYRGVPIIFLNQYSDGYGNQLIEENEILILGTGSTKLGRNQELEVMDNIDIDHKMWHLRMDEQYGVVVHYPDYNYRIEIS